MGWQNKIRQKLKDVGVRNVEAARDEVIASIKASYKRGMSGDDNLSPYGRSQKYRRRNAGKQTHTKDFRYSGTMLESIKEVSRTMGEDYFEIEIGFVGTAYRRSDQKDSFSTSTQAEYLATQQGINKVLKLSSQEKSRIQYKYSVQIDD